jgi:hypothetical protein
MNSLNLTFDALMSRIKHSVPYGITKWELFYQEANVDELITKITKCGFSVKNHGKWFIVEIPLLFEQFKPEQFIVEKTIIKIDMMNEPVFENLCNI